MKRLFSTDKELGITRWFNYDEVTDEVTIHTQQDLSSLVEANKANYQGSTSLDRWGDGKVVARVPLSIYFDWKKDGRDRDDAFLRRWINDPDNRFFRTRPGKI